MLIVKTSNYSGLEHTMEIDCTMEQIDAWKDGMLIQQAFPNLSKEDREFLLTGMIPEEWDEAFGPESGY